MRNETQQGGKNEKGNMQEMRLPMGPPNGKAESLSPVQTIPREGFRSDPKKGGSKMSPHERAVKAWTTRRANHTPAVKSMNYAYHLETKRVKEEDFPYGNQQLSSPQVVAQFAKSLQDSDIEKMLVLYLNAKNTLICIQITMGTIDRQVIYPREIMKHALLSGAVSIILIHNHPSGSPEPSPEDKNMTTNIKGACQVLDIRLLDHMVIGEEGRYFSFREAGIL
jgi:DNA repair protein RadC